MIKNMTKIKLIIVSSMVCTLLALGLVVGPGLTAPSDLPPRPTPPTPTAEPIPAPVVNGGKIILQTLFGDDWSSTGMDWQDLYTVVQWQDEWGSWHDVNGWRGTLDKVYTSSDQVKGMKTWWVPSELLGDGLFRWQVYTSQHGGMLAQSTEFDLPELVGHSVIVKVELTP